MGDDSIDVSGSLNSIGSLASSDLCKDRVCSCSRKFGRVAKMRGLSIGKVLEYSGDSRLANASLRGNIAGGVTMSGKRKDIFLMGRRDRVHIRSGVF